MFPMGCVFADVLSGYHEDGVGNHVGLSSWDCQCDCSKDPRSGRHSTVGWGGYTPLQGNVPAWAVHRHRLLGRLLLPAAGLSSHLPRRRQEESSSLPLWPSSGLDDCICHSFHVSSPKCYFLTNEYVSQSCCPSCILEVHDQQSRGPKSFQVSPHCIVL